MYTWKCTLGNGDEYMLAEKSAVSDNNTLGVGHIVTVFSITTLVKIAKMNKAKEVVFIRQSNI